MPNPVIAAWRRLPESNRGYIVAFGSVAVATVAVMLLRDFLSRSIFILFAAPIVMAAWYAGSGPAIFATLLGILAADLVFLERTYWIIPRDPRDLVAIGVYAFVGVVIVHLNGLLRRARAESTRNAQQLEEQAMELELQTTELAQQIEEAQALTRELETAHSALQGAHSGALAANRAKSDFLARMSHELRTPLAAIIGYAELLSDGITGPVNEEQIRQLHRIRVSADHLLSIIEEILTLARMEAGKEKVEVREVDLNMLLESVASMAEPLASAKGLEFDLQRLSPVRTIRTDAMKLRQVLLNLISNAVKYTESGRVSLSSHADDCAMHFVVADTGVGVAPDHLEKIFEPFWQVEQTTTRRAGGTGLGLAVTRQFVDLLGGSISVDSELGKGSAFKVTLPS